MWLSVSKDSTDGIDLIARTVIRSNGRHTWLVIRQIRPLVIRISNNLKCGTPIYDEAPVLTKLVIFSCMLWCLLFPECYTGRMAMPLPLVALKQSNLCKGVNLLCRTPVDSFEIMRLFPCYKEGIYLVKLTHSNPSLDDVSLPYPWTCNLQG